MAQDTFEKKHESKYLRSLYACWSRNQGLSAQCEEAKGFPPVVSRPPWATHSREGSLGRTVFVHFQALTTIALGPQLSPFPAHCFDITHFSLMNTVPLCLHGFLAFLSCHLLPLACVPADIHQQASLSMVYQNALRELSLLAFYSIWTPLHKDSWNWRKRKRNLKEKCMEDKKHGEWIL